MAEQHLSRSGRKPGSINRRSQQLMNRMEAYFKEHGFDVVRATLDQAMGTDPMFEGVEPAEKAKLMAQARRTLMDYSFPKLKAIELGNDSESGLKVLVVDATKPKGADEDVCD